MVAPVPEHWVFLSHVHEDEVVATWLRQRLKRDFLGQLDVYVSAEAPAGAEWFAAIEEHLRKSKVIILLCSRVSVLRPWVNFEMGAAWALKKALIPVCHAGLAPDELPQPFSKYIGVPIDTVTGLRRLYERVGDEFGFCAGEWDFERWVTEVPPTVPVGGHPDRPSQIPAPEAAAIRRRLHEAMSRKFPWRTIPWLATEAGLDNHEDVLAILREDDEVRFTRSKNGKLMAGLKRIVGP